jgi:3-oxoacyl-[acyl-carrier-protein] synthase II
MKRRRVKITGIGPVTPAGIGREEFWTGILEPVSRVRPYTRIGEEFGPFVAAQIVGFDMLKSVDEHIEFPKGSARHTLFAVAGTLLALCDAGVSRKHLKQLDCAVVTGSSLLDFGGIGSAIESVQKRGVRGVRPRVVFTTTLTSVPDVISQVCEITARTMTIQTSCCSGLDAIGAAAEMIATGEVDLALCGGTESPLHRFPLLELRAAGLTPVTTDMPSRIARPFDLWRTTGVVSEGACMFVLEPEDSPRPGYSYISGYSFANDPPNDLCGGLTESARLALAQARIRPSEVDAINAWGPGHKLIDAAEARAMAALFSASLAGIPVVSIKGAIGAALGAAPAIQVAAAALAQRYEMLPPTVNWDRPDPSCPLNLSNRPRSVAQRTTLINSHGVGNVNACIVLEKC